MQWLIVVMLVLGCAVYSVWTLMPTALRRLLARALIGLRWPAWLQTRLQAAAKDGSGCGCDGCDRAPPKSAASPKPQGEPRPQPLTFHPRRR